ncbi:MAG: NUDIX hydrolase [Betaproteobacteria bacterium]|nr:NUDIX hydrolase [Betaproteobacteria bacterium]
MQKTHTPTPAVLPPVHPMPFVRVELVIFSIQDDTLVVLQGKRTQAPYAGRWALPGGVLRIDLDKTLDDAVQRVAQERLGVHLPHVRQLAAVGGARRDPRAPWALSVVYRALVPLEAFAAEPGKRLESLRWVQADAAAQDGQLAFDHAQLIDRAVQAMRADVEAMELPAGFVPEDFTLTELQQLCEALLGHRLDKSSFRRKLDERGLVEPVDGVMRAAGAHRPAQVFRLRGASSA